MKAMCQLSGRAISGLVGKQAVDRCILWQSGENFPKSEISHVVYDEAAVPHSFCLTIPGDSVYVSANNTRQVSQRCPNRRITRFWGVQ
jgi:hypothetical protein